MAKGAYIGNARARKLTKAYIGVNGVARKIKKGYIGVNGVARMCFGGGDKLAYYGSSQSYNTGVGSTIVRIMYARESPAATTYDWGNGEYAIIDGSRNNGTTPIIDLYDESLVYTTTNSISGARDTLYPVAVSVGNTALFTKYDGTVAAYGVSATGSMVESLSVSRMYPGATTIGDYALFAGGGIDFNKSSGTLYDVVDAYDKSLTRTTATSLSIARAGLAATTIGDYALFAGGKIEVSSSGVSGNKVDCYDKSLTRLNSTVSLYRPRHALNATTVGDYAIFAGGQYTYDLPDRSFLFSTVEAYNKSLTRTIAEDMIEGRAYLSSTTLGNYAIFAGGKGFVAGPNERTTEAKNTVDAYDKSLTRTTQEGICIARSGSAATTVGDYALFAGGANPSDNLAMSAVDAYTLV